MWRKKYLSSRSHMLWLNRIIYMWMPSFYERWWISGKCQSRWIIAESFVISKALICMECEGESIREICVYFEKNCRTCMYILNKAFQSSSFSIHHNHENVIFVTLIDFVKNVFTVKNQMIGLVRGLKVVFYYSTGELSFHKM